ncbi:MAG: flagellar basal body protein [Peptostreptococcaceae bacterium]
MQTYGLLKMGLNAMDERSQTIAQNIANINTPNYKRKYVEFEESLQANLDRASINVKTDETGSMRNDGNNVDLEYEKVNQAATSLQYNALVSLTNTKIAMAKSVIGGR